MSETYRCKLERLLIKAGFQLIHDGQKTPEQFKNHPLGAFLRPSGEKVPPPVILPTEDVKFFTRKYRWFLEGIFVNTWVVFKYDRRNSDDWSVNFEFYSRDPGIKGREEMSLIVRETNESKVAGESRADSIEAR